ESEYRFNSRRQNEGISSGLVYAEQDSCIGGGKNKPVCRAKMHLFFLSLQCYKLVCHLNMLAAAFGAKSSDRSESRRVWVFICVSNFFQHVLICFSATQHKLPFLVAVLLVLK
ncbi:hypothetical protein AS27_05735, partial [Aptenodytes forsteri]